LSCFAFSVKPAEPGLNAAANDLGREPDAGRGRNAPRGRLVL